MEISHADIDGNDDALCLKSGRDSDGLRVNRPTYNVKIHDSIIRRGPAAVTIGSETSGGFHNIEAWNLTAEAGVGSGILFKSTRVRGGHTTDIRIHDITLNGVGIPISMTMDWNPNYSNTSLPAGTDSKTVPDYWIKLTTPGAAPSKAFPTSPDVHIWNIKADGCAPRVRSLCLSQCSIDRLQVRSPGYSGCDRRKHR